MRKKGVPMILTLLAIFLCAWRIMGKRRRAERVDGTDIAWMMV